MTADVNGQAAVVGSGAADGAAGNGLVDHASAGSATLFIDGQAIGAAAQADRGARLAGGLRRLGLREGDVLATLLRNGLPGIDVIHACRIAGVFFCPINWHFTADDVGALLVDSGARALLADADLLQAVAHAVPAGVARLAAGAAAAASAVSTTAASDSGQDDGPTHARSHALPYDAWLAAQAPYDGPRVSPRGHMAYTSGTTGKPKGVVRDAVPLHELPVRQAAMRRVVALTMGVEPGCRALMPAPLYHSAPSVFVQNALLLAERLVLEERFDAERLLALIEQHRIDTVYLVPIMYVRLLRLPAAVRARHDLSSLRFVASTGAPCAPEVKRAMIDWLGPVIHETYASSEAGMVTSIGSAEALARPGSAGRPVLDAQLRILHDDGKPCATGEIGLIHVRQPAYPDFTYRHNDTARRAIERDGLITLGDMGYVDADGYLFVCDRASDMVISGGVNIYPAEIEHRLLALPGVADCAVFGVPDAEYGERLHAVVEPQPGAALQPDQLRSALLASLASFKIPRQIDIAALPRDDNGKIAKRRLRDAHWRGQARRV